MKKKFCILVTKTQSTKVMVEAENWEDAVDIAEKHKEDIDFDSNNLSDEKIECEIDEETIGNIDDYSFDEENWAMPNNTQVFTAEEN